VTNLEAWRVDAITAPSFPHSLLVAVVGWVRREGPG
jgi:hypothetical protein